MVPSHRAARDLQIEKPIAHAIAAHDFAHDESERSAWHRHSDLYLAQRTLKAIEMLALIHQVAGQDEANLVDRVAKLKPAILYVHPRIAMTDVAAIDIGY